MSGSEEQLPAAGAPLSGGEPESSERDERRLLGYFLGLPRKVQMTLLGVVVAALAHLAGFDATAVRLLFGEIAERPAPSAKTTTDAERADQLELEGRDVR